MVTSQPTSSLPSLGLQLLTLQSPHIHSTYYLLLLGACYSAHASVPPERLYVCVSVCIYMYVCTYIHACMRACIHTCIQTYRHSTYVHN